MEIRTLLAIGLELLIILYGKCLHFAHVLSLFKAEFIVGELIEMVQEILSLLKLEAVAQVLLAAFSQVCNEDQEQKEQKQVKDCSLTRKELLIKFEPRKVWLLKKLVSFFKKAKYFIPENKKFPVRTSQELASHHPGHKWIDNLERHFFEKENFRLTCSLRTM